MDRALRLYADDVFLHFGAPASGTDDARTTLDRWMDGVDGIRTGLRDFDASGKIAYGTMHVVVNAADPAEDGTGVMVLVMKRAGSGWKIRSQTLVLDPVG